jgi:putative transposase
LLFGQVVDDEIRLNTYGQVVQDCWQETPTHLPHAALDTFVVMPNRVHGIVIIEEGDYDEGDHTEQFGKPVPRSLPAIVRSFKSAVTRRINQLLGRTAGRVWQRGYYEHVNRDGREWRKSGTYILDNPLKWHLDRNDPNNMETM